MEVNRRAIEAFCATPFLTPNSTNLIRRQPRHRPSIQRPSRAIPAPPLPCSNSIYDRWVCIPSSSIASSPVQLNLRFPKKKGHDERSVSSVLGTSCWKKGFRTGTQAQMRPVLTSMMLQTNVSAASQVRSAAVRSRTA